MNIIPVEKAIELSELRIGDYLEYDGEIVHVTSLSLDIDDEYNDTIGFCKLGSFNNEHSDWNRALADKLNRLPISIELIEKLGFTFCEKRGLDVYYNKDNIGIIIQDGACDYAIIYDGEWDNVKDFYYLHQLQNIHFCLTGEELTIKK